jgi:peptide subunit release factor 1 (eRF1)
LIDRFFRQKGAAMAALISKDTQVLLDQPKGQGMTVSCYADTSVPEGFASHWLQPLKTEASRIHQQLAEDHQARLEFERNLEVIRQALESPEAQQARGMAVFSATGRGFFLALPAIEPYENRLVVDEEPYVVPLLEAGFRQRGYLVVLTDTHRARWYAAGPGGSRPLGEIDESVPKKQHSAGERWGKQQATIERHRRDHILHFQKELARRVEQAWGEYPYQGIILLGEHEVLEQLRNLLPARLSSRVVHEAPQAWTEAQAEVDEQVRAVLETAQAGEESRVLAELDRRLREATAVAAGPQEVIDALRDGQVTALILGPDPGASASHCTGCHSLFVAPHAACPYCHAPCRKGNLWQEVLAFTVRHGIWVHRVQPSESLASHGGIAALLARDEPQWGPATAPARELKGIAQ